MSEIVKVQLPLFPPGATTALIYAEGRSRQIARDLTAAERRLIGHSTVRVFVRARWNGTDWTLIQRVADRDW